MFQLATGYIASSALQVAAALRIADQLADGPESSVALAAATGADEDRADALAGIGHRSAIGVSHRD